LSRRLMANTPANHTSTFYKKDEKRYEPEDLQPGPYVAQARTRIAMSEHLSISSGEHGFEVMTFS
jgi:hypothetical protein